MPAAQATGDFDGAEIWDEVHLAAALITPMFAGGAAQQRVLQPGQFLRIVFQGEHHQMRQRSMPLLAMARRRPVPVAQPGNQVGPLQEGFVPSKGSLRRNLRH